MAKIRTQIDGILRRDYVHPNTTCSNCPKPLNSDTAYIGYIHQRGKQVEKPLGPDCADTHAKNIGITLKEVEDRTKPDSSPSHRQSGSSLSTGNGTSSNREKQLINYAGTLRGIFEISQRIGMDDYYRIPKDVKATSRTGEPLNLDRIEQVGAYLRSKSPFLSPEKAKSFYKILRNMENTLISCREHVSSNKHSSARINGWAKSGAQDLPSMMQNFLKFGKISPAQFRKYKGTARAMGLQNYFPKKDCTLFLTP